ncbi:MAG: hypothetical protein ABIN91_07400 [Mucilaginibacter sp.]|uniref:HU domain-containing protein n=1 Tax=Mucilaginibacter sp. TaxID=1882438 RepID=UPI003267BF9D
MDIAGIISELLEHQEKLVVPGLGTFYRSRLEGYYSKEQQQFYPPSLQLQFNPELQEDDNELVQVLATEGSTSVSTARYHLDKFVSGIIQLAATENIPLGDLGTFSIRRSQLVFMPKKLNNNNELFYGLAPVRLRRNRMKEGDMSKPLIQMPHTEKPSAFTAALLRGEPMPGKPLSTVNNKEIIEEELDAEGKKPARISTGVLVIALIILISGISLIAAYKMKPALFDRFIGQSGPPPVTITTEKARKRQISDSIQRAIQAQKDIGATPVIDSSTKSKILGPEAPRDTFGIVIFKFAAIEGAQKEYDRYRYAKGLVVEIRRNPDGGANPYQLTVAHYFNADSAKNHLDEFKKQLRLQDVFIQKYPYKTQ